MKMQNTKRETQMSVVSGHWPVARDQLKREFRTGFTLMELMVAVGILVMIILGVGVVFSGVSKSIGISQATMENMAGVRETQRAIEHDLQGLDRNGYLVIRSRVLNYNVNPIPSSTLRYVDVTQHYDQLSFLARGTFPNRSGADTSSPFTDSTTSNTARVWWGQLILEKAGADADPTKGPYPSYVPADQSADYAQSLPPTGLVNNNGTLVVTKESDFTLGRQVTLLVPGPAVGNKVVMGGQNVMAYPNLDITTGGTANRLITGSADAGGGTAHISASRYSVAAQSPAQVMNYLMDLRNRPVASPEAERLTYRFRALDSVYDTEIPDNPFVNGYFRTTPVVMRGVSSFKVEWTDGTTYTNPADPLFGQLVWWGPGNAYAGADTLPSGTEQVFPGGNGDGDHYVAIFSYFNKGYWPKALRISMHVASDRVGGRDFVQVVELPQ
jgi:type II secretory pathway pseudopilin PulG